MREILFRGKYENGEWMYGDYTHYASGAQIWTRDSNDGTWNVIVDPETVGQYIGLTDKNRKKIFEGDIIKTRYFGKCSGSGVNFNDYDIFKVAYQDACFYIENAHRKFGMYPEAARTFEIVGNIHDNPELLKGGEE